MNPYRRMLLASTDYLLSFKLTTTDPDFKTKLDAAIANGLFTNLMSVQGFLDVNSSPSDVNSATTNSNTGVSSTRDDTSSSNSLSTGGIAGIVIGVLVAIMVGVGALVWMKYRKGDKSLRADDVDDINEDEASNSRKSGRSAVNQGFYVSNSSKSINTKFDFSDIHTNNQSNNGITTDDSIYRPTSL